MLMLMTTVMFMTAAVMAVMVKLRSSLDHETVTSKSSISHFLAPSGPSTASGPYNVLTRCRLFRDLFFKSLSAEERSPPRAVQTGPHANLFEVLCFIFKIDLSFSFHSMVYPCLFYL